MGGMLDKFHAGIEKAFGAATDRRTLVTTIRKHADEKPELLATRIVEVVPKCLKESRAIVLEVVGIDLADTEAVRNFKTSSVAEWQLVSWLATRHQIYSAFLRLAGQYFRDPNLTDIRSAQAVCEAFLEATERQLYAVALDFDELCKKLPKESFPTEELVKVLSGIVASRTSPERYERLRVALTAISGEDSDSARHEQLLRDLPGALLAALSEGGLGASLSDLRNRVSLDIARAGKDELRRERKRRIDPTQSISEGPDLTRVREHSSEVLPDDQVFQTQEAVREELEERIKRHGLAKREAEAVRLRFEGKETHEIAARMGIKEGTVRAIEFRIRDKAGTG